ncbi:MAG: preprotein translocase subunit SecA [Clostridiales bacterium]|nr:preprotein translocase subunit SecA [Clostridiales bacterium]
MGLFGNQNKAQVKKLRKIADEVVALEEKYKDFTNEQLRACTDEFKDRLKAGASLNDILPEAYAVVREASTRVLNMRHYYVQILGGIALHQGRIAEMATGEGKTLVETLPAYLNALTGEGVHIVTVNEYLAKRDAEWMGKVYKFLGLTVGVILNEQNDEQKRKAYLCDITYCTNNELGFDYLRDNMARSANERVQRGLKFAVVDEVDSILIDEARTPLIISGKGNKSSDGYVIAQQFVNTLSREDDVDIDIKTKQIILSEQGVSKAEAYFNIDNLSDINHLELNHNINNALRANFIMKRDENYIVKDGEVIIVDEFTGRLSKGRRFSSGLHQAIEAKEGVEIKDENQTLATITFQNFFRLYSKLSGMTGTAKTEESEFRSIYSLDVVEIPPNRTRQRVDYPDIMYVTENGKIPAIIEDIKECQEKGRPVLVGTINIDKSEMISKHLKNAGIKHQVLNAKNNEKESEIVAQAGRKGAVTIATNMAGRGTDILLGGNPEFMATKEMRDQGYSEDEISYATAFNYVEDEALNKAREVYTQLYKKHKEVTDKEKEEVKSLGGLHIIGTERHESRRIDNQLRGRAGRQGDPGSSVFYLSLDDDLFKRFATDRLRSLFAFFKIDDSTPLQVKMIAKQIEASQRKIEIMNFGQRKSVLQFDDVMNKQREIIYAERNKVLDGQPVHQEIMDMYPEVVEKMVRKVINDDKPYYEWDLEALQNELEKGMIPKDSNIITEEFIEGCDVQDVVDKVLEDIYKRYDQKVKDVAEMGVNYEDVERNILLRMVDVHWISQIESMQIMKDEIISRQFGQQDPVIAYKKEGFEMFDNMIEKIRENTCKILLNLQAKQEQPQPVQPSYTVNFVGKELTAEEKAQAQAKGKLQVQKTVVNEGPKTGRNDPCPCGSGKKYKNCCWAKDNAN